MHDVFQSLDPFPFFYVVLLESLDGLGNNLRINITVCRNNEMISLVIEDVLPPKSLWNASISAYGCETHTAVTELSETLNLKKAWTWFIPLSSILGTHDLRNVAVNSSLPGQIRVRGDFLDGSTATGVLLIIYSLTTDLYVHYIAKQKEAERVSIIMISFCWSIIPDVVSRHLMLEWMAYQEFSMVCLCSHWKINYHFQE